MILYNVTISVEKTSAADWVQWMKEVHSKDVMATGLFNSYRIFKVLFQQDETLTYSVQYLTDSLANLQQYQARFAQGLQAKHTERYGEKAVAFRTVLEAV